MLAGLWPRASRMRSLRPLKQDAIDVTTGQAPVVRGGRGQCDELPFWRESCSALQLYRPRSTAELLQGCFSGAREGVQVVIQALTQTLAVQAYLFVCYAAKQLDAGLSCPVVKIPKLFDA